MRYTLWILATLSIAAPADQTAPPRRVEAEAIVAKYTNAVGGTAAISAITTRVTRGTFDNGRGLVVTFVTWIKLPEKLATQIGRKDLADAEGSGRASDGRIGWDKNFVGTGLRSLTTGELVELKRTADPFRPAHLIATCSAVDVEERRDASGSAVAIGLLTPFRERIAVPGANVTYAATTIRFNEAVPDSVFVRPAR